MFPPTPPDPTPQPLSPFQRLALAQQATSDAVDHLVLDSLEG